MRAFLFSGCFALAAAAGVALAGSPKNLQVYPKNTPKKAITKDMKKFSKALGVKCKYCHDMPAYEKDTKKKEIARDMMRLTNSFNENLAKEGYRDKITCNTCHRGKEEPAH